MFCSKCGKEIDDSAKFCSGCGAAVKNEPLISNNINVIDEKYPTALPIGTILAGQYVIDKVLGQGSFGITYKATDHKNGKKVAVKEFFPESLATRQGRTTVKPYSVERGDDFIYGRDCFLQEAETLSHFIGNENIVRVYTYFEENCTAYFVMDYVEGVALDAYIKSRGGRLGFEEAKKILFPVMDALAVVHSHGIVHRDVAPDNIYITSEGKVMLLDFGAARYSLGDRSRSLDVILKHGYAPKEQYARRGRQGPFTDVYALGATFYYAITGKCPPDSVERIDEDSLIAPSAFGVNISRSAENVLLTALNIYAEKRYQNMTDFKNALLGIHDVHAVQDSGSVRTVHIDYDGQNPIAGDAEEYQQREEIEPGEPASIFTDEELEAVSNNGDKKDEDKKNANEAKTIESSYVNDAAGSTAKRPSKKWWIAEGAAGIVIFLIVLANIGRSSSNSNTVADAQPSLPTVTAESEGVQNADAAEITAAESADGDEEAASADSFSEDDGSEGVSDGDDSASTGTYQIADGYVIFGSYEQDGDTSNGPEPIEWEVLDDSDGKMLLISRYILDCQPYNTKNTDVTWENCTLRNWLNTDFIKNAFSNVEQSHIVMANLSNPDNTYWGTAGGNDTKDRVFCLSVYEIKDLYWFEFWYETDQYGYSSMLTTSVTPHAEKKGAHSYTITHNDYTLAHDDGGCGLKDMGYSSDVVGRKSGWWWLRSPGGDSNYACNVDAVGHVGWLYTVDYDHYGVRPALYLEK